MIGGLVAMGAFVVLLALGVWLVIPYLAGAPWVPSSREVVVRALELAGVREGEVVFDLGAGDGRVLLIAAREFGARAVGVEIEFFHCVVAWLWAWLAGVHDRVEVRWGNILRADFSSADVVFLYLLPPLLARLEPSLRRGLSPEARVISVAFPLPGWKPKRIDVEHALFVYEYPSSALGV